VVVEEEGVYSRANAVNAKDSARGQINTFLLHHQINTFLLHHQINTFLLHHHYSNAVNAKDSARDRASV